MNTKSIITALFVAATVTVNAQGYVDDKMIEIDSTEFYNPHRISVNGTVGYGSLLYSDGTHSSKGGIAGGGGIDYTFFFKKDWGIGIGANYMYYGSEFSQITDTHVEVIASSSFCENYVLHQELDNTEKLTTGYINIPIKAHYRTRPFENQKWELNAALGVSLGIPVYDNVKMTSGTITRWAYFPDSYLTFDGMSGSESDLNLAAHEGIGVFSDFVNYQDEDVLKLEMGLNAEVGFSYRLNDLVGLDASVYATYGLTDIKKNNRDFAAEQSYSGIVTTSMIDNINTLFVGVKLGASFDMSYRGNKRATDKAKRIQELNEHIAVYARAHVPDTIITYECSDEVMEESLEILKELQANREAADEIHELSSGHHMFVVSDFPVGHESVNRGVESQLKKSASKKELKDAEHIFLVGRADESGSKELNDRLSLDRANAVKDWLVKECGISASKISVEGRGSVDPISESDAINRSVVIIF